MSTAVIDDPPRNRYELLVDDVVVGFANYELASDQIAVLHVEVDRELGGRGLGRELVDLILDDARRRGLFVVPRCPFTRRIIAENQAAYLDLVPVDARKEFGFPG